VPVTYGYGSIQRNGKGEVKLNGTMEMIRSKENARLYDVKFRYTIAAAVDVDRIMMWIQLRLFIEFHESRRAVRPVAMIPQ